MKRDESVRNEKEWKEVKESEKWSYLIEMKDNVKDMKDLN